MRLTSPLKRTATMNVESVPLWFVSEGVGDTNGIPGAVDER